MTAVALIAWALGVVTLAAVFALGWRSRLPLLWLTVLAAVAGAAMTYMVALVGMSVLGVAP